MAETDFRALAEELARQLPRFGADPAPGRSTASSTAR